MKIDEDKVTTTTTAQKGKLTPVQALIVPKFL